MFTPTPATDGYGDREDIANARDFSDRERIAETKRRELTEMEQAIERSQEWGILSTAQPITAIVKKMLEAECYGKLLLKGDVIWDVESIHDAINDACIALGLDEDDFSASYHDLGDQIDLRLAG